MLKSARIAGLALVIASIVFGVAMTLFIKMGAAGPNLGPFATSGVILIWMLSALMACDGISLVIRGKNSERLRFFGIPILGLCLWVVPTIGLTAELGTDFSTSVLCMLVAMLCGAKFTAKII